MERPTTTDAIASMEIMTIRIRRSNLRILEEQKKTNELLEKMLKIETEKEMRRKISA